MLFRSIKEKKLNICAVLAVSFSTVIAMLDSTIANVALPIIAKDFAVSEFIWRVAICAFGFGLFQSPNNYLIMTSVSHENSTIASGLLGSSCLVGKTICSALVAILFNIYASYGTTISLFSGALFTLLTLTVSYVRYKSGHKRADFNKKSHDSLIIDKGNLGNVVRHHSFNFI